MSQAEGFPPVRYAPWARPPATAGRLAVMGRLAWIPCDDHTPGTPSSACLAQAKAGATRDVVVWTLPVTQQRPCAPCATICTNAFVYSPTAAPDPLSIYFLCGRHHTLVLRLLGIGWGSMYRRLGAWKPLPRTPFAHSLHSTGPPLDGRGSSAPRTSLSRPPSLVQPPACPSTGTSLFGVRPSASPVGPRERRAPITYTRPPGSSTADRSGMCCERAAAVATGAVAPWLDHVCRA